MRGCPVDYRLLGPPVVSGGVDKGAVVQKVAGSRQLVLDNFVGVSVELAYQVRVRDFFSEAALVVHWGQNVKAVAHGSVVVVFTKAGSGVDQAGTIIVSNVDSFHQKAVAAFDVRVLGHHVFHVRPLKVLNSLVAVPAQDFGYGAQAVSTDNVAAVANFNN